MPALDSLSLISLTLGGFLAIFTVATLLTLPLRLRTSKTTAIEEPKEIPSSQGESWVVPLLGAVIRPVVILTLTWCLLKVLDLHPEWLGSARIDARYIKAWYLFWVILLFFNINEAIGRLFYFVHRRRFPIPSVMLFLLRLLLIGATSFAIFHFVLDFDTSQLLTSTAVVAAVVGIALREVLSNFLAGLSMNLVGTVEPSQWIAVGDKEGEIIHRNWRETRLRSTSGHIYIIPNSTLAASVINNMTWNSPLRRHQLLFTLSFGDFPQEVKTILRNAASSVDEVEQSKPVDAFIQEFRDYGVVYLVRFWSRTYFDRSKLEGLVRERVWYQLRRHGLSIPFPDGGSVYSVAPTLVPKVEKQPEDHIRILQQCGFFTRLLASMPRAPLPSPEKLLNFAALLVHRVYGPNELLFRQGEVGRVCHIVARGHLLGMVFYEGLDATQEFRVETGELVGEMALLTDLPRTATVKAGPEEVELLEVSSPAFDALLAISPEVQHALTGLAARRSRQLFEQLQHLEPGKKLTVEQHLKPNSLFHKLGLAMHLIREQ
ncbi:MAG: mechanosensitive ion channel family protein [Magnetococcales bacterium]|nr:mechanosensitive ion channel family protein [Magnetococcales bacterium]